MFRCRMLHCEMRCIRALHLQSRRGRRACVSARADAVRSHVVKHFLAFPRSLDTHAQPHAQRTAPPPTTHTCLFTVGWDTRHEHLALASVPAVATGSCVAFGGAMSPHADIVLGRRGASQEHSSACAKGQMLDERFLPRISHHESPEQNREARVVRPLPVRLRSPGRLQESATTRVEEQ